MPNASLASCITHVRYANDVHKAKLIKEEEVWNRSKIITEEKKKFSKNARQLGNNFDNKLVSFQ